MATRKYGPPLQMPGVEKWVTAADTRVRYFQAGSGPPLILLHGLGGAAVVWYCNMEPLARGHTVYAMDLPGHGASEAPPWSYSLKGSIRFMESFMDVLGLQQASIAGNSLGGLIALALALERPRRVNRLILEDAAGLGREVVTFLRLLSTPILGNFLVSDSRNSVKWVLKQVVHNQAHITERLVDLIHLERSRPGNRASLLKVLRAGVSPMGVKPSVILTSRLGQVEAPTLVIWGREDRIFPMAHGHRAAQLLPKGQLRIFDRCGHWPHMEVSPAYNRTVLEFLA